MKPTQQEIIELAREAGVDAWWDSGNEQRKELDDLLGRLVHLALEHFGAGGGEPVLAAVFDENLGRPKLVKGCPELYHGQKLYTHHSPTDLRAEYERGLDDAAKVCEAKWSNVAEKMYGKECADAIRALKGKQ